MESTGNRPRATVIVTTYENPSALALVFAGLARQTSKEFEVLVADDGSGKPTATVIHDFIDKSDVVVRHVWQPDDGLRKSRILNRAILAAAGDYLIFTDGDCVPGPRFIESHLALTRPRTYLSGSAVLLGPAASDALTPDDISRGALDGTRSCRPGNRRARRVMALQVPALAPLLDRRFARHPVGFHGNNSSVARSEAIAVGGFDERLERLEDKDFGHRLRRHGVRAESVRYRVPVWHLHHERPYVSASMEDESRAVLEANTEAEVVRTPHGLVLDPGIDAGTRAE